MFHTLCELWVPADARGRDRGPEFLGMPQLLRGLGPNSTQGLDFQEQLAVVH